MAFVGFPVNMERYVCANRSEEPELYEIISEIMYADVQICTKYAKQEKQSLKLDVPFLVFTGEADDEAPPEDMEEWRKYTNKDFILKVIKGDHFFAFKENGVFGNTCVTI